MKTLLALFIVLQLLALPIGIETDQWNNSILGIAYDATVKIPHKKARKYMTGGESKWAKIKPLSLRL